MPTLRSWPLGKLGTSLAVILLLAACATLSRTRSPLQDHMEFHFAEIHKVQAAVIRGDLDAIRDPAQAIALQADHPDMPRGVDSPVDDLRRYARQVAAAQSLDEAASNTASLAAACGRCHAAGGTGPRLATEFPPSGQATQERMRRHDWAARRMWDGLIANNLDVWRAGASALVDAPMVPDAESNGELEELAQEVNQLGRQAGRLETADARAGLYGRLLATCAACHSRLEGTQR